MGSFRRWLLWGLVLAPVTVLPSAFIGARIWLNHHLQRELSFGDLHIRLVNPVLGWRLTFSADSLEVLSPKFEVRAGTVDADLKLWQSLVSLQPSLEIGTDTVRIGLAPDTASEAEKLRNKANRKPPMFPNVRIPIPFQVAASQIEISQGAKTLARIRGVRILSQGPKGAAIEADGFTVFAGGSDPAAADTAGAKDVDTAYASAQALRVFSSTGSYRVSVRWFGKSLRYQARFQNDGGDFVRMEGGHRKIDLRLGEDSLEAAVADLGAYAVLFPHARLPVLRDLRLEASVATDTHLVIRTHAKVTTPPFFVFGAEHVDAAGNFRDSSGRMAVSARGDSGESLYLQGQFQLPTLSQSVVPAHAVRHPTVLRNALAHLSLLHAAPAPAAPPQTVARLMQGLSATLTGYSRNLHMSLGGKVLPADVEIRRLRISPGLLAEADLRTRDSSAIHARAYRDSSASSSHPAWKCSFAGKISPRESWAHGWTDTNIAYRDARVSGEIGKAGLMVEAWTGQARAYGAAADSVYAKQEIHKDGYYLTDSRLYWKDVVWPITGQVVWGKRDKGGPGRIRRRHRQVSLVFRTKHPRYGTFSYSMPRLRYMEVRAQDVVLERLPYPRLARLFALKPVVTGSFDWDWLSRTGRAEIHSPLTYAGENLGLDIEGGWDPQNLSLAKAEASFAGSKIRLSGDVRLGGRQFYEMRKLDLKDIRGVALETESFDAARLSAFLGSGYPVERGRLNGRLAYTDTTGFRGTYTVDSLDLKPIRKHFGIKRLTLMGEGESLALSMRTAAAPGSPWMNDTVSLTVSEVLGRVPGLTLRAVSDDGLTASFQGRSRDFRDLDGDFALEGRAQLPGQAGAIRDVRVAGHLAFPFANGLIGRMTVDSASFRGRYAVPGLDTQSFHGSISVEGGRLRIPDLRAENSQGPTLSGEADCDFNGPPKVTAKLRGEVLAVQWPGIQKLVLRNAEASLVLDSSGLNADATVGSAEFRSVRPPVTVKGTLEGLSASYHSPPAASKSAPAGADIAQLKVKARMRDFLFQHKLGFREVQRFFRTVKVDKRKKRIKPMDVQISLETAGPANRIDTDILRMYFTGDLNVRGIYPYTLLTGEFSALAGELGQSTQSYDITDFDLKWQNATLDEGRISVEGRKRLHSDCKPDTKRTCSVFIKLDGRLDEMGFTYDSDCGTNTGEAIEPAALINSVSRGCYSDEYVAGAGAGNYGEAVVNFLEPTINEKLSSVGNRYSLGWIKSTQVSGIGTVVSNDTAGSEPIAIGVESKEKWGLSLQAKAGYHPEKKLPNPWEDKVALEWRPPLEKVAANSEWKRRVRDRVMLEASAETRPEEKVGVIDNKQQVRKQVGITYHYKFWNLW